MLFFFFFNDTATTEIYTLSLHDALPICARARSASASPPRRWPASSSTGAWSRTARCRSEEHTSELQSRQYLVCRLLLEKKKTHCLSIITTAFVHFSRPLRSIPTTSRTSI